MAGGESNPSHHLPALPVDVVQGALEHVRQKGLGKGGGPEVQADAPSVPSPGPTAPTHTPVNYGVSRGAWCQWGT